ncbi:unnamed protein product [Cunninghamella echinulata]
MYKPGLKYIAISYRWGELDEQLVKTPDYTAHITSFNLYDLSALCEYIQFEPDLKGISYLWIDAISVDQQNDERKKETILKMSTIYKNASYILAVPDLHSEYLWKNPANIDKINLIQTYSKTIYNDILNYDNQTIHQNEIMIIEENEGHRSTNNNNKAIQTDNNDIKKAYKFLAYLVHDWSNRAWVISEYHIAKEKEKSQGTPLKYIFLYLLHPAYSTFLSYSFDHQYTNRVFDDNNDSNNNTLTPYWKVNSSTTFIHFLKTRFTQYDHLEMILSSNAKRNEDRFNAILPSWRKYNHLIKDKSTISSWNITDMTSVRLKLYELMDDLWDKARLLFSCSCSINMPILPSFASYHDETYLFIYEKENPSEAYQRYYSELKNNAYKLFGDHNFIQEELENNEMDGWSFYTENLTDIHLNPRHPLCLSIKSNKHFIFKSTLKFDKDTLSTYLLKDNDSLKCVLIPFFTFTLPGFDKIPPKKGSDIFLLGNMDQNRWVLLSRYTFKEDEIFYSCCYDDYTFNVY